MNAKASHSGGTRTDDAPPPNLPGVAFDPERIVGRVLREFRVEAKLGNGAMGTVFKAYDRAMHRSVALKSLAPDLAQRDPRLTERFEREAMISALLDHPNIVRGLVAFEEDGVRYLAMEYLDGRDLEKWVLERKHLSVGSAVKIALDVARALAHAHTREPRPILHRDIKPANIVITGRGEVKLVDLGVAKIKGEASDLTYVDEGVGTPAYMPPEQRLAVNTDERSDLYALGVTLYRLLTGEKPFTGSAMFEAKEKGEYRSASRLNPDVPEVLDAIIHKLLEPQPSKRYQTAAELVVALEATALASPHLGDVDPGMAKTEKQHIAASSEPRRWRVIVRQLGRDVALVLAVLVVLGVSVYAARAAYRWWVAPSAAVMLAQAVEQMGEGRVDDARASFVQAVQAHPFSGELRRPLDELEHGVVLLFQYERPGQANPVELLWAARGTTLTERDNYRFGVIPGRVCSIYAFQRDARPSVATIFPNRAYTARSNPLPLKQLQWIPDDPGRNGVSWMHLDASVGREQVVFVAVSKPLRDPMAVARQLAQGVDAVGGELAQHLDAFVESGGPAAQPCFSTGRVMEVFQFDHE